MRRKYALTGLVVVCVTVLIFTFLTRGSLCELSLKKGDIAVSVHMAYEVRE